jgi:hypothetical protein
MTPKQEEALRDYLQEVIVPLIEEVLVKKLGQAMTFAKKELAEQPAQQEPVAWIVEFENGEQELHFEAQSVGEKNTPLYTSPPAQRTWVGLTDEEAQWLYDNCRTPSNLIDMTEAKLRERNT